ncbi:hypothetical protein JCM11957_04710 [Caminibacter profundus]
MKKIILLILSFLLLFASDEEEFLKTLNEVSEIATQNKLNIDKTPSNVDIIRRDFIIRSGARTLLDLLKYIPGVEIAMTSSGKRQLIIRGNKSVYRDKIKLMINGVEVTNNLYNNQFYYYNFPASLIKRIEFTKTPDSVLYGENAFLGVLNVITLNNIDDNMVNFYLSNKNQTTFALFDKINNNLLADFHYLYSNPEVYSPKSYLIDLQELKAIPFRNETRANTLEKNVGIGLKYTKEKSTLSYRTEYYKKGDFFGIERVTPLRRDKFINFLYQYLNYNYSDYLKYNLKVSFDLGVKNYIWDGEFRTFPYDFNESVDHNDPSKDIIIGAKINEIEFYAKNLIKYETDKHNINFILEAKYAKPYDYYYLQYIPIFDNKEKLTGDNNVLKEGIKRISKAIGIEDLFTLNEKISFVYGFRYDNYSDFGGANSYKLGGVYNLNEKTTFKLLFNKSFRVPSWVELYARSATSFNGNENLKPESIAMVEFIWLQRIFGKDKLKFVIYRGLNKNFIGRNFDSSGKRIYENLGDYIIKGFEISYKKLWQKLKVYLSYAYNNNKSKYSQVINNVNITEYQGVRHHQYKGYLEYIINKKLSFFSSVFYGSKVKLPNFIDKIDEYFSLNANIRYSPSNDFSINIGVENITNHKNYMIAYPSDIIGNRYFFVFEHAKIPYTDRKLYINLTKEW